MDRYDGKDHMFNIPPDCSEYDQVQNIFNNELFSFIPGISIKDDGDNVVKFLSQIGWTNNSGNLPEKKIAMNKIYVYADLTGGNGVLIYEHLHGKMPHRRAVMEKVFSYLNE